jgi:hypothetical protein
MFIHKIKVVTRFKFIYIYNYECAEILIIEINKKVIILLLKFNLLGVLFKFI